MIKIKLSKKILEVQPSELRPEYLKAGHGVPEPTKGEFAGMEERAKGDNELGYELEETCDCGCEECMSGNHYEIDDEKDDYASGGGDPDLDGDGVYSPEELYYHFDLNKDGSVEPQEYEDHVEWHAENPEILDQDDEYEEYVEIDEGILYEKKDRCYYLAKQKYDVFPSAYASGFIVRCRKGKLKRGRKKKRNEALELDEKWSKKYKRSINCKHPKGFSQRAHCQGRKKHEQLELDLDELLMEGTFDKEKSQGLHGWFARKGGKGKSKGWVDCNTCRTNPKTGRKTCKTCGREPGEKRSKYPACRPTPSACTSAGTSRKKSSTRVSWKPKRKRDK